MNKQNETKHTANENLEDIVQPNSSFPITDLLKGPLPQDNPELVSIIKEKFINNPSPSDVAYNLKYISGFATIFIIRSLLSLHR